MKKVFLIISAVLIISSCALWNATMDNVIRTYNLEYGLKSDLEYHQAEYRLLKLDDFVLFSKYGDVSQTEDYDNSDYDPEAVCTEVFVDDTDDEPGSSFALLHGKFFYGIEELHQLDDGTPILKADYNLSLGSKTSDGLGNEYFVTKIDSFSDGYGYVLDGEDQELDVYDLSAWTDSDSGLTSTDAIANIPVPGFSNYLSAHRSKFMVSDDMLAFWAVSSSDDFDGMVFFDISTPAAPVHIANDELETLTSSQSIDFHLEGDDLYIYGTTGTGVYFHIWDVSDPTSIPGVVDISSYFSDFQSNSNYPYQIRDRRVFYFDPNIQHLYVWDITDPENVVHASANTSSTWDNPINRNYPSDCFTIEDNIIYIPSGNNIQIWEFIDEELIKRATGYVGAPLLGAYKFPDDPYVYTLGYDSINMVSVKY